MFTGITEHVATIDSLDRSSAGGKLRISLEGAGEIADTLKPGDSIAVNGCCLTAVEIRGRTFSADLSSETLARTSFNEKQIGDSVNIERPLATGARLGGHFVQGHVDGIGRLARLVREGDNWWLSVRLPQGLWRYVAEKGSIALDGISLTVAKWQDGVADIAVIPFTYAHTNVRSMAVGDAINVETDILAKYVAGLLELRSASQVSQLTVGRLIEEGF